MPALIVRRASTVVELARRPELRDRRPAAEHQPGDASSSFPGSPTCRSSAALFRSAVVRAQGDRSRHHRHAAPGEAGQARRAPAARRSTPRSRPTNSSCSSPASRKSRSPRRAACGRSLRSWATSSTFRSGRKERQPCRRPQLGRLGCARLSLAAIALLVAGCQDYAVRRDTIAFHAGEAIAHNKAVHVIDPWPAVASSDQHSHRRAARRARDRTLRDGSWPWPRAERLPRRHGRPSAGPRPAPIT